MGTHLHFGGGACRGGGAAFDSVSLASCPSYGRASRIVGCTFPLFLSTGMPIGFLLLVVGFIGICNIRGAEAGFNLLGTVLYRNTGSYTWSVFPLFVLMGYICYFLDISKDLFDSAYKFLGRLHGGLAIATIGSCTAFGAIAGDNGAGAATMGVVAYPELKRYKYNNKLALGASPPAGPWNI